MTRLSSDARPPQFSMHRFSNEAGESVDTCRAEITRIRRYKIRQLLMFLWDARCVYCQQELRILGNDDPSSLTIDHVEPVVRGGADAIWNYVPACGKCNSSRRDTDFSAFMEKSGKRTSEIEDIKDRLRSIKNLCDHPDQHATNPVTAVVRGRQAISAVSSWNGLFDESEA